MKLAWTISKRRGNWRPVLEYTAQLEDWELALAVDTHVSHAGVLTASTYGDSCPAGTAERADPPQVTTTRLYYPDDARALCRSVTLRWRPGAHPEYPEVGAAMAAYMTEWEDRVNAALESPALEITGTLEASAAHKRALSAYVAARKMLATS